MEFPRYTKQANKFSRIVLKGLSLSSIQGRFNGPRVLVNSVPKASTNLLQELVHLLPLMRGRITRSLTLRNGTGAFTKELLHIKKGQCEPAHITYDALVDKAIMAHGIWHVFVIRDFRDVIMSNIQIWKDCIRDIPIMESSKSLSPWVKKIDVYLRGNREANMLAWA